MERKSPRLSFDCSCTHKIHGNLNQNLEKEGKLLRCRRNVRSGRDYEAVVYSFNLSTQFHGKFHLWE